MRDHPRFRRIHRHRPAPGFRRKRRQILPAQEKVRLSPQPEGKRRRTGHVHRQHARDLIRRGHERDRPRGRFLPLHPRKRRPGGHRRGGLHPPGRPRGTLLHAVRRQGLQPKTIRTLFDLHPARNTCRRSRCRHSGRKKPTHIPACRSPRPRKSPTPKTRHRSHHRKKKGSRRSRKPSRWWSMPLLRPASRTTT